MKLLAVLFFLFSFSASALVDCSKPEINYLDFDSRKSDSNFKFSSLASFQKDVESNIMDFCSCHYMPYLQGVSEQVKSKVQTQLKSCLQTVYCAKSSKMSPKNIRKNYSSSKLVCSSSEIKEWNRNFKEELENDLSMTTEEIKIRYCGRPQASENDANKCYDRLVDLVGKSDVKSIKQKCQANSASSSTASQKLCVENYINLFILDDAAMETHWISLTDKFCPNDKSTIDACVAKYRNQAPAIRSCTSFFQVQAGKDVCEKLALGQALDLKDKENFACILENPTELECKQVEEKDRQKCLDKFNVCSLSTKQVSCAEKRTKCIDKVAGKSSAESERCLNDLDGILSLNNMSAKDDDKFNKLGEKMCKQEATKAELGQLLSCYDVWKKAGVGTKGRDEKFEDCLKTAGLIPRYDLRSWGQTVKDEFACVTGCETLCKKRFDSQGDMDNYKQCVVNRVGWEASKAILAELAKEGGMLGASAATGLDVMSCIQPKGLEGKEITDAKDFCLYLEPSGNTTPPVPTAIRNECPNYMNQCSQYTKGGTQADPSRLFACGSAVVKCLKTNRTKGEIDSCVAQEFPKQVGQQYTTDRTNQNSGFSQNLCMAGALLNGLQGFTSAYCNDDKKFPSSTDKNDCLKKFKAINEVAQIGGEAAQCMALGPKPVSSTELSEMKTSNPSAYSTYESMQKDRDKCLVNKLGDRAIDLLGDKLGWTDEQKQWMTTGKNFAAGAIDCSRFNNPVTEDEKRQQKACWAALATNTAGDALMNSNLIKDENLKQVVNVAFKAGAGAAACTAIADDAQKKQCMISAGLNSLTGLPGAAGQVAGLANTSYTIYNAVKSCEGQDQRECVGKLVAGILPGNAGIYANYVMRAYTLLKTPNTCGTPSKKLAKAAGVVALTGEVATAIYNQIETKKLKKEFGSLVSDEKAKSTLGLYENVDALVNKNNKDRSAQQNAEAQAGDPDIQIQAMAFKRKTEQSVLKKQLINRPFFYTSAAINAASITMATFEIIEEKNPKDPPPWLTCEMKNQVKTDECEKNSAMMPPEIPVEENIFKLFKRNDLEKEVFMRDIRFTSLNRNLNGSSDAEAMTHYLDLQRYLEGYQTSLSVDDFNRLDPYFDKQQSLGLSEALQGVLSNEFRLLKKALAFDLSSVDTIAATMGEGLFQGQEGFSSGDPGAFAEKISYEIIHQGMKKLCSDKKKVNGECQYAGQKTLEFVARKAVKIFLTKNKCQTNKFMSTAEGRVLIAGWNAYSLGKTIVENEKMIKDQRLRVKQIEEIEKQMQASTSPNWKKWLKWNLIDEAYASVKRVDPDLNMKICVNKNDKLDSKCSCKASKSCFEVFPTNDRAFNKNLDKTAKGGKEAFKSSSSLINQTASVTNQLLNGNLGTEEIDVEEMQKTTDKLNKFNKELLGKVNQMLISKGRQGIFPEVWIPKADAQMFASLDPDLGSTIKAMNMGDVRSAIKEEDLSNDVAKAQKTPNPSSETGSDLTAPLEVSETEEDRLARLEADKRAQADDKYRQVMNQNDYEYDENSSDINSTKEHSIFEQVSKRYRLKLPQIQQ